MSGSKRNAHLIFAVLSVSLVALVWLVFAPTIHFAFVNFDDDLYVYDNTIVGQGLTLPGIHWALLHAHAGNWHPVTTISHMLDCQLWGVKAGPHHFMNVLYHALGVVLLFLTLQRLTGALWRSAFVAGLFAIHPQHVESVAWISERKDILSGIFFLLTLLAYRSYVLRRSVTRYLLVLGLAAAGLAAKPMLVTLPFVLLLLDYWPLERFTTDRKSQAWLFIEKVPLFVLSLADSAITYWIQVTHGSLADSMPLSWRLANALVSYCIYLWQMIWPATLAPLYPHPEGQLALWKVITAFLFLISLTTVVVLRRRSYPYLFVGWLWYLGMLIPVIGLVQVGAQGWADRYTYLPAIGIYVAATWFLTDCTARSKSLRIACQVSALAVISTCAILSHRQTYFWKDSETLWTRVLAVTTGNHTAENNLGVLLDREGKLDAALQHYRAAAEIRSSARPLQHDFSLAAYKTNVASVLRRQGNAEEAISLAQEALTLQPGYGMAFRTWADALVDEGQTDEAVPLYQKALESYPADAPLELSLAQALLRKGIVEEAIRHFEKSLAVDHDSLPALNNLAWLYCTNSDAALRNGSRGLLMAQRAVQLSGGQDPFYLHKLAAAYAEEGDFGRAISVAESARQLAMNNGNSALATELQRNIEIYETNSPLRDNRRPR